MIVMKNVTEIFQFLWVWPWYNLTECAQHEKTFFIFAKQKSRPVALSSTMLLILWKTRALCILSKKGKNIKSHVMRRKHVSF